MHVMPIDAYLISFDMGNCLACAIWQIKRTMSMDYVSSKPLDQTELDRWDVQMLLSCVCKCLTIRQCCAAVGTV
jgi:hypothetical protein